MELPEARPVPSEVEYPTTRTSSRMKTWSPSATSTLASPGATTTSLGSNPTGVMRSRASPMAGTGMEKLPRASAHTRVPESSSRISAPANGTPSSPAPTVPVSVRVCCPRAGVASRNGMPRIRRTVRCMTTSPVEYPSTLPRVPPPVQPAGPARGVAGHPGCGLLPPVRARRRCCAVWFRGSSSRTRR